MFPGGFGDAGLYRALGEAARIEARMEAQYEAKRMEAQYEAERTKAQYEAIDDIYHTHERHFFEGNYFLQNQRERKNCLEALRYTREAAEKSIQQAYDSGRNAKEIAREALRGTASIDESFKKYCVPALLKQECRPASQPAKTNETTEKISKIGLPKVTKAPSPFDAQKACYAVVDLARELNKE